MKGDEEGEGGGSGAGGGSGGALSSFLRVLPEQTQKKKQLEVRALAIVLVKHEQRNENGDPTKRLEGRRRKRKVV